MLEKCQPSFYGKDATEKLNTLKTLLSTNDFASLIASHESKLTTYIANLRKAEIFERCADATTELNRLKSFVSWEEDYSLDYKIYNTLTFYCESVEEFIAHSNKTSNVTSSWIANEVYQWNGGNSLEWELSERFNDDFPGEIHITCLSLLGDSADRRNVTAASAV